MANVDLASSFCQLIARLSRIIFEPDILRKYDNPVFDENVVFHFHIIAVHHAWIAIGDTIL
jgi:hypothetical protein